MKMHPPERISEYRERGWWTDETVQQLLIDKIAERGDAPGVYDPPNKADIMDTPLQRLSWNEFGDQVERLAAVLLDAGIGEGDIVAVQLPNSVELTVAYFAVWRVRAIISPLPIQYREHETTDLGNIAGIKAFLTADRVLDRHVAADVVSFRERIPTLETVLHHGPTEVPGSIRIDTDTVDAARLEAVAAYADAHPVDPNDCITICWTSGTESKPKGVPRAHYEWLAQSWNTIYGPELDENSRMLNPFPMVNMAGINGILFPWLRTGCLVVQHQPFDLQIYLGQIQNEKITYTLAPPAILALLLQNEQILESVDISSLTHLGSGSAPLQEWMVSGWWERHGIPIVNFFGSNEGITLMTDVVKMQDAAQRAMYFPFYGHGHEWTVPASKVLDARLVNPETGEDVTEAGVPGELYLKGATIFNGYLDQENVANPFDEHGYLMTGDVFELAGENLEFLHYVGRSKEIIIRGGMNISPAELETLVGTHPAVAEVAVVPYPDDVLGEKVCVFVATRPGQSIDLAAVVEHLRGLNIASYKLPERLELIDSLPRNPVGKVLKRDLRDQVAAD